MRNKNATLRNTLPAICTAITAQKGVKIIWSGPPKTNGRTIWSNPLPVDADENTVKMVIGDIDHECGHILYTNFPLLNKEKDKMTRLHFRVWNALEDTFDERRMGDDFVGCQQTLAESAEIATNLGMCRMGTNGPSDALITYCDSWGRKNVLLQKVDKVLDSSRTELVKYIEESGVERLEALLATKLYSANSTQETLALSAQVIQLIKDIQDEQESKPKPKKGEGKPQENSGEGKKGETGQENGSQPDGQNGKSADKKDPEGAGENPKAKPKGKDKKAEKGNPGSGKSPQSESDSGNKPGQGKATDEEESGDGAGRGGSARLILEDDNVSEAPVIDRKKAADRLTKKAANNGNFVFDPRRCKQPMQGANFPRYNALKAAVSGHIAQLQRRLMVEFQTRKHCRSVVSEEGRLDSRRLHQAITGNPAVYRKKVKTQIPTPAVSLVLDCSISMEGAEIQLATQAVIALAEVCNTLSVPVEVVTFGGDEVGAIKTFDDQLVRARGRIGAIGAGGGTPTAEALWVAGNRLFNRKEERKILMLVTDGEPDNMPYAQQVASMVENSGIELYGIGLGTKKIREICHRAGVITEASDLAQAILNALAERMLKAA